MCAVFGLLDFNRCLDNNSRETILRVLSIECEIRGTDATGYAFNEGELKIVKKPVPAHKLKLRLANETNIIHGHTRMTTKGNAKNNYNNHPFFGIAGKTKFALAHNGVLHCEDIIRKELGILEGKIETDSFLAVQILEKFGELNEENLAKMAETVEGDFVFTMLDEHNNSYFVRGNNPLAIYKFDAGFYVYASTEEILNSALKRFDLLKYKHEKIETKSGDILKIDSDGNLTRTKFDTSNLMYGRYFPYLRPYYYDDAKEEDELKSIAQMLGFTAEDVELLLDYGYLPDEIEEFLYDPDMFWSAMEFVYEDFGIYGEF